MVNNAPILFRVGWLSYVIVASVVLANCDSAARQLDRPTGASPVIQTKGWQMHTDPVYGFAIEYPKEYVILKEITLPTPTQPAAVKRVRFQQKHIAAGQFADLEPPMLTIQVFPRPSGRSLRDWLNSFGLLPPGSEIDCRSTARGTRRGESRTPAAACAQRVPLLRNRPVRVRSHPLWSRERENAHVVSPDHDALIGTECLTSQRGTR